jgi:hypothetical protein
MLKQRVEPSCARPWVSRAGTSGVGGLRWGRPRRSGPFNRSICGKTDPTSASTRGAVVCAAHGTGGVATEAAANVVPTLQDWAQPRGIGGGWGPCGAAGLGLGKRGWRWGSGGLGDWAGGSSGRLGRLSRRWCGKACPAPPNGDRAETVEARGARWAWHGFEALGCRTPQAAELPDCGLAGRRPLQAIGTERTGGSESRPPDRGRCGDARKWSQAMEVEAMRVAEPGRTGGPGAGPGPGPGPRVSRRGWGFPGWGGGSRGPGGGRRGRRWPGGGWRG